MIVFLGIKFLSHTLFFFFWRLAAKLPSNSKCCNGKVWGQTLFIPIISVECLAAQRFFLYIWSLINVLDCIYQFFSWILSMYLSLLLFLGICISKHIFKYSFSYFSSFFFLPIFFIYHFFFNFFMFFIYFYWIFSSFFHFLKSFWVLRSVLFSLCCFQFCLYFYNGFIF